MLPLQGYANLSIKPNHIILSTLQPKSDANAWKPSYVQRKRHQLTALAFEAKQKEQEHAVTRAKQAKTKAETYGKYGYLPFVCFFSSFSLCCCLIISPL